VTNLRTLIFWYNSGEEKIVYNIDCRSLLCKIIHRRRLMFTMP